MKKQLKKRLALLMVLVMTMAMMPIGSYAQPGDLTGHWSESVVSEWMTKGLIKGYPDGSFKPDGSMTRAEFMAIVNKVYNFTLEKDISLKDVKQSDWFYAVARQATAAGYIAGYPDGTLKPNQPITRAEVSAIFCKLESLNPDTAAANFSDLMESYWAKGYIGAVVKAGYFTGYGDGTFKAMANIKRGEAVVATNKVDMGRAYVYDKAGTYGPDTLGQVISKNVIVKANGVVLQNMTIKGDLTIDEAVGEGDVSLNNVVVEGQLFVKGGGSNSVKINGGSYGKVFVMKTADTPVRLLVVNVKNLDVVIAKEAGGGQIILEGAFNSVSVLASKAEVKTQGNTTINEIRFDKLALEVKFNIGGETVIAKLIVDVVLTVLGQGRIITADVNVTGVVFEKQPETVNTTTGGTTTTTTTTPPPSTPPSSGDNGTIVEMKTAAKPSANQVSGYLASGSSVTLSASTAGSSIYYTLNNTTPSAASTLYSGPITISGSSVTVKAIAVASGYYDSAVFSATYYTQPLMADVSVASGSAIFVFEFFADNQKTMAIPYADVINPNLIALDLTSSTIKLAVTSNAAVVTSTSAVTLQSLGINVTSGSVTFTTGSAIIAAFGDFTGWSDAPNTIILHLEFIGGNVGPFDFEIELTPSEMGIIQNMTMVSLAPLNFTYFLAQGNPLLLL